MKSQSKQLSRRAVFVVDGYLVGTKKFRSPRMPLHMELTPRRVLTSLYFARFTTNEVWKVRFTPAMRFRCSTPNKEVTNDWLPAALELIPTKSLKEVVSAP